MVISKELLEERMKVVQKDGVIKSFEMQCNNLIKERKQLLSAIQEAVATIEEQNDTIMRLKDELLESYRSKGDK